MTRPAVRVELDGKDKTAEWSAAIESITITDEAGIRADTCEVAFDGVKLERGGNLAVFSAPPIGAELRVWLGYEPNPVYVGRYRVAGWSKSGPFRRLTVRAMAADMTSAIREPKLRSFHETTVRAIVEQVAGDHGLKAQVDAALGALVIGHIDQQGESDVAFLTRLAGRLGATFKIGDGKVIFAAKGSSRLPGGGEKDAKIITCGPAITSWSAECSERGRFGSTSATYRDPATHERRTVTSGSGTPVHRDRKLYGSRIEAQAAADAAFGDLARGKLSVTVDMPGNPDLFAEALVTLQGFDSDVDGKFLAKSVTHSFSGAGYTSSATLETIGAD